jgi:glutaredoxin
MLKKLLIVLMLTIIGVMHTPTSALAQEGNQVNVYYFYVDTCYYCGMMSEFLDEMNENPNVSVYKYEIAYDEENQKLVKDIEDLMAIKISAVPYVIVGRETFVGYQENITNSEIKNAIDTAKSTYVRDVVGEMLGYSDPSNDDGSTIKKTTFTVPFFGEIDAKSFSLPALAVVMGTIDGFNPCAMWVLLLLISMLVHVREKWKMWTLGIVFLLTSAIMYFFFMLSWLNITMLFGSVFILRLIIGMVAIGGGSYNVIKCVRTKDGCEVIDEGKRKKFMVRIKQITSEKRLIVAIIGIIGLAITVNLVELLCSAGLPIVFTQVLSLNNLSPLAYVGYLLLYVFFFLIDDLVIFFIAMKTYHLTGLSTRYAKVTQMIGGIIMIALGILMLVKPEWLMFQF